MHGMSNIKLVIWLCYECTGCTARTVPTAHLVCDRVQRRER